MFRTRVYRDGVLEAEDFDMVQVSDWLLEPDTVVWVDLVDPGQEDFECLSDELGLHKLAVEDAMHESQRAKVDRYADHLFITTYAVRYDADSCDLHDLEIDAFVAPRYLVTVRRTDHFDIQTVVRRWDDSADLAKQGVGFLLWGLLDVIVDGHFEAITQLDDAIEDLEQLLFEEDRSAREVQRRSFDLRKALVDFRRVSLPMREVINTLLRRDLGAVTVMGEAMAPYYQDVYDHVLRVTEWTDSLRDLVTTVLETNLTIQGNRLNEIMKRLTGWAAIIAVPTLVTGFYGMNVRLFPAAGSTTGFWFALSLMIGLSVALYVLFQKKDWI